MTSSNIKKLFMGYVPLMDIAQIIGMNLKDLEKSVEYYIPIRAEKSLKAIDLTGYSDRSNMVKMLVTKLSVIRNELFRRSHHDLAILTMAETVDNMIKKVKLSDNDTSEWFEVDDITIIEETGQFVSFDWVYLVETSDPKKMLNHARALTEKYIMKPEHMYSYLDYDSHTILCKELGINPREHSEESALSFKARKDKIMEDFKDTE